MRNTGGKLVRIAALVLVPVLFLGYGLWEAGQVRITRVEINDPFFHSCLGSLRIVHLSDIHLDRLGSHERLTLEAVKQAAPDMICVTGDIAQWNRKNASAMDFLEALNRIAPTFAAFGDADLSLGRSRCFWCHDRRDIHHLREIGPTVLRNQVKEIMIKGRRIAVAGLDPGSPPPIVKDFMQASGLAEISRRAPVVILGHFSKYWSLIPPDCHILWLAGDTHGGQIWVPKFLWPLFRGKDHEHIYGLFGRPGGKWLFVTSGIGTTERVPFRIGRPPEAALITFVSKAEENKKGPFPNLLEKGPQEEEGGK